MRTTKAEVVLPKKKGVPTPEFIPRVIEFFGISSVPGVSSVPTEVNKAPKPPDPSSLLIKQAVGSGTTKRDKYTLAVERLGSDSRPPHVTEEEWLEACLDAWRKITPEETTYVNIEKTAKGILEAANLPTENPLYTLYTIPGGIPLAPEARKSYSGQVGDLRSLVVARGYKERIDMEWYAGQILTSWFAVKGCSEKGLHDAANLNAFALGMLTQEMEIRFGVVAENARKGGSRKKLNLTVMTFLRSRLRATPSLTAPGLWRELPRDEFEGLKIGQAKLFIERDRLYVLKKQCDKTWLRSGSLSYPAFRKYVTIVRKSLPR